MKKKNLKSLWLNKKPVSSLNMTTINGGAGISELIGCVSGSDDPVGITDNCVPSRSCPSQINSCILCW